MNREEMVEAMSTSVSMEMVCVCGNNLTGAEVDHMGLCEAFAREAHDLGWRPDGSDVLCPACAEGSAS